MIKDYGEILGIADFTTEETTRINMLVRMLAHEIRNPLNALVLNLKVIDKLVDDNGVREAITAARNQTERVDSIIADFVDFTKPRTPNFDDVNVVRLLNDLRVFTTPQAEANSLTIKCDIMPGAETINTDPNLLNQALLNLLLNAIDASNDSVIVLYSRLTKKNAEAYFEIGVQDNGPGFKNSIDALKPFYSTKDGGTGLGLTTVSVIAKVLGGELVIQNIDDGANVYLKLPAVERSILP